MIPVRRRVIMALIGARGEVRTGREQPPGNSGIYPRRRRGGQESRAAHEEVPRQGLAHDGRGCDHERRSAEKCQATLPMDLLSILSCPHCERHEIEAMPTDSCQFFYDCKGCGAVLRPKVGDCCVFCTYGSVPCPPIQAARQGERSSCYLPGRE